MSTEQTLPVLPLSGRELDAVVHAYLGTALWSSIDPDTDEPLDDNHDVDDVAAETREQAKQDVRSFLLLTSGSDLIAYLAHFGGDVTQIGHDLWLTRNGHGTGFWDRGLGELGDRLTAHADTLGGIDLYVGDDGLIYGM